MTTTLSPGEEARWLSRAIGLGYGLFYSLVFGLTAWGYDALTLSRRDAELAWAKLAMGLPFLLLIGAVASAVTRRSDKAGACAGAWMVSGALMGGVVGLMPFVGYTVATWIAEPLLWGMNIYPLGPAEAARIAFVAIVTGCMGSAVGLVGHRLNHVLTERAQGSALPTGQVSERLWAVLILCLLLAVLPGMLADEIINRPLRARQQTVYEYDWPGFEAQMDGLIQETLEGEQDTELEPQSGGVSVSEGTLSWFASQREVMSEHYEISRDGQRGGWVITSAHFDTGYVLTCYFNLHGAPPVVLDHCSGK